MGDFSLGCTVRLVELVQDIELNGQRGYIVGWDDEEARWNVIIEDGSAWKLRPGSLELLEEHLPGQRVRVVGLRQRPEMNGREGVIISWNEMESRWSVRLSDGSGLMLRPISLEVIATFHEGQCVSASSEEHTVMSWDVGEEKWILQTAQGTITAMTPADLNLISDHRPGQHVRFDDPLRRAEIGTLKAWDGSKWIVEMSDGCQRRVLGTDIVVEGEKKIVQIFASAEGSEQLSVSCCSLGGDELAQINLLNIECSADLCRKVGAALSRPADSLRIVLPCGGSVCAADEHKPLPTLLGVSALEAVVSYNQLWEPFLARMNAAHQRCGAAHMDSFELDRGGYSVHEANDIICPCPYLYGKKRISRTHR